MNIDENEDLQLWRGGGGVVVGGGGGGRVGEVELGLISSFS